MVVTNSLILKSSCCGADVEDDWFPGKKYRTVDDIKYTCSKCHKPRSIAKLPKASKVKEVRGNED